MDFTIFRVTSCLKGNFKSYSRAITLCTVLFCPTHLRVLFVRRPREREYINTFFFDRTDKQSIFVETFRKQYNDDNYWLLPYRYCAECEIWTSQKRAAGRPRKPTYSSLLIARPAGTRNETRRRKVTVTTTVQSDNEITIRVEATKYTREYTLLWLLIIYNNIILDA